MRRALPLALVALPALAAAQVPAAVEFRVNSYTTTHQYRPFAAMDATGAFVVAWTSIQDGPVVSSRGVYGQRFAPDGAAVGGEFLVNTTTNYDQISDGIAMEARQGFVVVWSSLPGFSDVFGRRYDAAGAPLGPEFAVNTHATGSQSNASVAMLADGRFLVAWQSDSQDGSSTGIYGRRFAAAGTPIGGEFQVNVHTADRQELPSVGVDAAGNAVIVWSSLGQDGSAFGVYGRRFDAAGLPIGDEFRANVTTASSQLDGRVAVASSGEFVVTWMDQSGADGSGNGIFARRFDAAGVPRSGELRVNTETAGPQRGASVAIDESGFVVAWTSDHDYGTEGVFAQRYDRAGAPRGGEFRVNTYVAGSQATGAVASDAGNFVAAWAGRDQDGDGFGIFAQRFGGLVPEGLSVDPSPSGTSNGNGIFEAGESAAVAPAWRNVTGTAQTFTGAASAFTGPGAPGDPIYLLKNASADYGTVVNGAAGSCATTGDCYLVAATVPSVRPLRHWDASLREDILPVAQGQSKVWAIHVGDSFTDVLRSSGFYRFIETVLHHGLTSGCGGTRYCPGGATTREQMAVFLLVAKEGLSYAPPPCGTTPLFADVPVTSAFCPWIEEVARRAISTGCGPGLFCPSAPVTREQMAVFVVRALDPALNPPPCVTAPYGDVPAASPFCRWILELTNRGVVSGCGGGNFCPTSPVTREQMSVFLTVTFGLTLYGP